MNVVDSSGWLEYFANHNNASFFAPVIEDTKQLIVPTICVYEVFKHLMGQRGEDVALVHVSDMYQGQLADLTAPISLQAAKLSIELQIAMADSIILATARGSNATLWTQDADFESIEGVEYIKKKL